jgi:hypothetical protein
MTTALVINLTSIQRGKWESCLAKFWKKLKIKTQNKFSIIVCLLEILAVIIALK